MGHRVTQRIYTCDCCGAIPEDGEYLWEMAGEYICEKCIDSEEYEKHLDEKTEVKESK